MNKKDLQKKNRAKRKILNSKLLKNYNISFVLDSNRLELTLQVIINEQKYYYLIRKFYDTINYLETNEDIIVANNIANIATKIFLNEV